MNDQAGSKPATDELNEIARDSVESYNRYQAVKKLTQALGDLPNSAPLPEWVTVKSVNINYTINGIEHAAVLQNITRVGDLAALLSNEIEFQVDRLRTLALTAQTLSASIAAACEAAQYNARAQQLGGLT